MQIDLPAARVINMACCRGLFFHPFCFISILVTLHFSQLSVFWYGNKFNFLLYVNFITPQSAGNLACCKCKHLKSNTAWCKV